MDKVPVGTMVHYHRHCKFDGEPAPAMVVGTYRDDVLRLLVFHNNGDIEVCPTVYHKDSPSLYDEQSRLKEGARRNGCWSHHPWNLPPQPSPCTTANCPKSVIVNDDETVDFDIETMDVARQSKSPDKKIYSWDEKERRVLEIIDDGDFDYVYKRAKFWGVTKAELEQLLRKHGKVADVDVGVGAVTG